jgi:Ca2+-binding EF-hand superfamily protein
MSKKKKISMNDFANSLGILGQDENKTLAKFFFKQFNRDPNGIDFEEYLFILSILLKGTDKERLECKYYNIIKLHFTQ